MKPTKDTTVDQNWQEKYSSMIQTAEEAVKRVKSGHRVFIGTGCGQPLELVRALVARSVELADTELVHTFTMGDAPYAAKEMAAHFSVNSFFIGKNVREIIQEGEGSYTPIFLSDIPHLFQSGRLPLDVALIQVTPPDERGFVSLGISVDVVKAAAENASLVIAQVNRQMPWTMGNSFLHVHDLDILVPVDVPLIELEPEEPTEVTRRIGELTASLIGDGSTLEIGIGKMLHPVLESLHDKKDLGIHTEMLTDGIVDLIEEGVITGAEKTVDRGKIVASFCLGTRKLYDYMDHNPIFAMHPSDYVNDPFRISRHKKMIAVNTAFEVDLTGQVCADSIGGRFFSGIGGQVDFNRGAARAPGGKAIIALPSTAKNGSISRISAELSPGAGVVTTRGDVEYVVTEHGVAYLHGKNIQERALALISIAHPKFRAELFRQAIEHKYIRPELADKEGKIVVEPKGVKTSMLLYDGTQITFRAIHPTDEPKMRDLFYDLSKGTIYYRFMTHMKQVPRSVIQNFVYIDHRNETAIVGTLPEAYGEEIIAIGRYYLDQKSNLAEVAFIVRDEWQNRGIGKFLLKHMIMIAKQNGIAGFTAEVLAENKAMQTVFNNSGCRVEMELSEGVYSYRLDFE